jgi:hypothetical protein
VANGFFDFDLAGMWRKALRELEVLRGDVNPETIFDFFVTSYHVMDYVKAMGTVPKAAIDEMYKDPDFGLCQFICNKGKHLELRQEPGHDAHSDVGATPRYAVIVEGRRIDVLQLARAVVGRWRRFFEETGIRIEDPAS